jgi:hypothetical protein
MILQATKTADPIELTATDVALKSATLTLNDQSARLYPAVPQ